MIQLDKKAGVGSFKDIAKFDDCPLTRTFINNIYKTIIEDGNITNEVEPERINLGFDKDNKGDFSVIYSDREKILFLRLILKINLVPFLCLVIFI